MNRDVSESIYQSDFVRGLFDEMSRTYGVVNVVSSFGFCALWRRQCVDQIDLQDASRVVDLMSGMGELNRLISKRAGPTVSITGYDISTEMCKRARENVDGRPIDATTIEADVLEFDFEANSADVVVSCFGLKTFSEQQQTVLAEKVFRMLKPGGKFAFLEISIPAFSLLRLPYEFYLNYIIPVLGKLFLGNPDNYRLLGVYTRKFDSCKNVGDIFCDAGLDTSLSSCFFGCATGVWGTRPE